MSLKEKLYLSLYNVSVYTILWLKTLFIGLTQDINEASQNISF